MTEEEVGECSKAPWIMAFFVLVIAGGLLYVTIEMERDMERQIVQKEVDWLRKEKEIEVEIDTLNEKVNFLRHLATDPYRGRTLTLENALVLQDYTPNPKHAIVTMMGFPSEWHPYWMGAVAMMRSLRESQTRVPNLCVMSRAGTTLPDFAIEAFKRMDVQIIDIDAFNLDDLNVDIPGTWGENYLLRAIS